MDYKGYIKTITTKVSENGIVTSVSEEINVNWEMNNNINISAQQQQQQSSREDGPGVA